MAKISNMVNIPLNALFLPKGPYLTKIQLGIFLRLFTKLAC